MGLEWIYDHPFTSTLICAAIELWICHRLFERFFFFKGLRRLRKRELGVIKNLKQTHAIRCATTMGKWTHLFIQLALIGGCLALFFFGNKKMHELYIIESTPKLIGKVLKVETTTKLRSKGGNYYVYDHMVEYQGEFKKEFQVVRSRTRRAIGADFGFHEDGDRWIEHRNKQNLGLIAFMIPFSVFIFYFSFFFFTVYPQIQRAVKRIPLGEVTVIASDKQRIKNGWNVYLWFFYEDILYTIIVDGLSKKKALAYEDLEGESINVHEFKFSFPGHSPRKYFRRIGLTPKQEMRAKFLAFKRPEL